MLVNFSSPKPKLSALRQKSLRPLYLFRQISIYHVIQIVHRKRLLLGAHSALLQLQQGVLPFFVVLHERIVLNRVVDPLDIDLRHLVRWQVVIGDIVRRYP